ncbi:ABC-type uncharacterized transport system, periplasmic component [Pantoea agglomerans]|uniref:ABC-type uncharacterized transport system, periplasmic component n=1 Tax=Enterobacter agglomerans TaxID=549 RepID=A0A379AD80_ENTAG|nr:ABC-type uncharacterized transport system, periplasmic component [Pantoea agglomerans]
MKRTLFALLMVLSPAVMAHPHSFIDMKTELVAQDDTFTGLKMTWTMDEITSADLLYDAGEAKTRQRGVEEAGGRRDGERAGPALLF